MLTNIPISTTGLKNSTLSSPTGAVTVEDSGISFNQILTSEMKVRQTAKNLVGGSPAAKPVVFSTIHKKSESAKNHSIPDQSLPTEQQNRLEQPAVPMTPATAIIAAAAGSNPLTPSVAAPSSIASEFFPNHGVQTSVTGGAVTVLFSATYICPASEENCEQLSIQRTLLGTVATPTTVDLVAGKERNLFQYETLDNLNSDNAASLESYHFFDAKSAEIEVPTTLNIGTIFPEIPTLKTELSATVPINLIPDVSSSAQATSTLNSALPQNNLSEQNSIALSQGLNGIPLNTAAPVLSTLPSNFFVDAPKAANATPTIAPRINTPNWNQAIGEKINWMVIGGHQSASLTLNPPDLGPLQIVIHVNNQQADATFISHHSEVRAALEHTIPKLREMMGQSGIQLGECNVNSQPRQQQESGHHPANSNRMADSANKMEAGIHLMHSSSAAIERSGVGLVDTFV